MEESKSEHKDENKNDSENNKIEIKEENKEIKKEIDNKNIENEIPIVQNNSAEKPLNAEEEKNDIINKENGTINPDLDKKEEIHKDNQEIKVNKIKKNEIIVKEINKKPNLSPMKISQLKPSITKIKHDLVKNIIDSLLNPDEQLNNKEEVNDNNKFTNKLNDLQTQLLDREDKIFQKKWKKKFYVSRKGNDQINNRYKTAADNMEENDKDILDFKFSVNNLKDKEENKCTDLKDNLIVIK